MRWTPERPSIGERRLKKGFLIFPRQIRGQVRWLEFTSWIQIFQHFTRSGKMGIPIETTGWVDWDWNDEVAVRVEF